MNFLLSSDNVLDYLCQQDLCTSDQLVNAQVQAKEYKNFNLLIQLMGGQSFLVKQVRLTSTSKNQHDLWSEWQVHNFIKSFSELKILKPLVSNVLLYDPDNAILVVQYFEEYDNLGDFYDTDQDQLFPTIIPSVLGHSLAKIHQATLNIEYYKNFLILSNKDTPKKGRIPNFLRGLERMGPGLFGDTNTDGIDFWRLYQRYESLHKAMIEISQKFDPCCLTHNDLNHWNIILHSDWDKLHRDNSAEPVVRIIDWEFFDWGDPTYDLSVILAGYLRIWLKSLVLSKSFSVSISLKLATTPLEKIQPSLVALTKSYIKSFPDILKRYPDFLIRVLQFTGMVLIKRVQGKIEDLSPFDNTCVATLQVAKTLLCSPEQSIDSVFGVDASHFMT